MTAKSGCARPDLLRGQVAAFQKSLLRWFVRHRRDLPWRRTPTPYRVWISEIMLQQTRVKAALPYYERFLKRFPDVRSLARASESDVLELWAGLGYYSRARNLHRAAVRIVDEHRGRLPHTFEDLVSLPGIGRYTAGAILSIAHNKPAPIVDGNIRRLICRLQGITRRPAEGVFWHSAAEWTPADRASEFNQALMELGALICLPSSPSCEKCPVSDLCEARRRGIADRIPATRTRRRCQSVHLVLLVVECRGHILLYEGHAADFVPGRWGLPSARVGTRSEAHRAARILAQRALGTTVPLKEAGVVSHTITYRRIRAQVFHSILSRRSSLSSQGGGHEWTGRSEAGRFLTSSLYRKALSLVSDASRSVP